MTEYQRQQVKIMIWTMVIGLSITIGIVGGMFFLYV